MLDYIQKPRLHPVPKHSSGVRTEGAHDTLSRSKYQNNEDLDFCAVKDCDLGQKYS